MTPTCFVWPAPWSGLPEIIPPRESQLEKSVAIDPRRPECHYNLGLAFANLGDYARGKDELEKALVLGETDPDVHFQLAMEFRNLGQAEQAKAELKIYERRRQAKDNRKLAAVKSTEASEALAAR